MVSTTTSGFFPNVRVDVEPFQALYPFASHYLRVKGGVMHYLDEGEKSAPVLLMLHGNPTWSFYFRELVHGLSNRFRVIVPDHLGCGLSDKPRDFEYTLEHHIENVETLVRHLGLQQLTLVVHDWGGAIGMGYATRHPRKVDRLVVFNSAAFPSDRIPFSIDICRIPGFGALMIQGLNAFAKVALLRAVHHRERLTPAVKAGYLAPYDSWEHRVANLRFVQDIPMSRGHRSRKTLEEVAGKLESLKDKPMLIVWGAKDFCFNHEFLEEWRRRFPNAEVHEVADAGHYVVEDAHERIILWMRKFLGVL